MKTQPSYKPKKNTTFLSPLLADLAVVSGGSLGCVGYVELIEDSHTPNRTMPIVGSELRINREGAAWITMGKMAAQTLNVQGGVPT